MSDQEDILPKQNLLVMQIVASGLVSGVGIFLAIVLVIVQGQHHGAGLRQSAICRWFLSLRYCFSSCRDRSRSLSLGS